MSDTVSESVQRLRVRDVMTTSVVAIEETEAIDLAKAEMSWCHVRHFPVVGVQGKFAGLVSETDFRIAAARRNASEKLPVATIMRTDVFTISPDAPLAEAIYLMLDNKLTALPVLDRDSRIVGILTESDFVRRAYREVSGRQYARSA